MKNYTDISPKGFESGHQTGKLQENSYRTQNGLEDARRALRDNFESTTLDI